MTWEEGHTPDQLQEREEFVAWVRGRSRCQAITFAGQPGHLLVRCKLTSGHSRSHEPSWSGEDRND